ncbi:UNVERIFIED_CONTAM: hypothetical protein Sangu_1565500 [Sesamum angustifolium]|uniref:CCHC-type domain-containing protein n=1 Tax=Sesamum angustifolium TaxID=2727405 RepID=A0AAW2MTN9_9LAMI
MPEDYVHDYYTVDMYKKAYAPMIMRTSGEILWEQSLFIPPLPPDFGRGPGRPSNARRREPDEATKQRKKKTTGKKGMRLKRQQATVHCTICGEAGHNQRLCPFKEGPTGLEEITHEVISGAETLEGMQQVRKKSKKSKVQDEGNQASMNDTTETEIENLTFKYMLFLHLQQHYLMKLRCFLNNKGLI